MNIAHTHWSRRLGHAAAAAMLGSGLWLTTAIGVAQVTPTADGALQRQVQQQVLELDAPTAARRSAAEQSLIDLGKAALSLLPLDADVDSAEARLRLSRVRERLQSLPDVAVTDAVVTDIAAPLIRLDSISTLAEALAVIETASGVRFEHPLDPDTAVAPLGSEIPFWHAVDYVLDETGLDIDLLGRRDSGLPLLPRATRRPARVDSAAYAGWFRLEPTSITNRRLLRSPDGSSLHLDIEVSWPPHVTPLSIAVAMDSLIATLDDEQTIHPVTAAGSIDWTPRRDAIAIDWHLDLQSPAVGAQRIRSLAGRMKVTLAGQPQRLEIPVATKTPTDFHPAGPVAVALERIRANGELSEWVIAIQFRNPDLPLQALRGSLLSNPVYVLDKAGKRHDHLGYQVFRQNAEGLGISYLFDLGESSDGAKLCYETTAGVTQQDFSFEIKDILLP